MQGFQENLSRHGKQIYQIKDSAREYGYKVGDV